MHRNLDVFFYLIQFVQVMGFIGILTTQENARSFSSYVTTFGVALLISSIIYLKRLDNSISQFDCALYEDAPTGDFFSCSQFKSWRVAAIIGIVIGVIDVMIFPFLLCCIGCTLCTLCGYAVCVCCTTACSDDKTTTNFARNGNRERETDRAETATINIESDDRPKSSNKYDVESAPSKWRKLFEALVWITWVSAPFIATLYICYSLYKYDAIRTRIDELFSSALALFIIALLNMMVYFQKFMSSICGYGHQKVTEK